MLNIEFASHLILQGNNKAPKSTNKLNLYTKVYINNNIIIKLVYYFWKYLVFFLGKPVYKKLTKGELLKIIYI